ncbi:MAG: DUF3488 and transglutaminase-like domain-containing protein [Acidobacteriota bacterium]|nr:DUF3488 and transglutaminase-like domain-containing protein [Acidobacteriota bacterium]
MIKKFQNFEYYFRAISYLVAFCGVLSLFFSGGVGIIIFSLFILLTVTAWFLEDTNWQISEKMGVILIILVIPFFYLDWKFKISGFGSNELLAAGGLARLILFLSGIKLMQKKSDKDWIFIYVIAFFEVLLAAGLSISPSYLATLFLFLLSATCAIIAFEIRKTSRDVLEKQIPVQQENEKPKKITKQVKTPLSRLPLTAITLLILITIFAIPLFFTLPRVGGAGIGSDLTNNTKITGFSDLVKLGEIGILQQNDKTVMRVRLDKNENENLKNLRWRGVALDYFDNKSWSKTRNGYKEPFIKGERNFFLVNYPSKNRKITVQTFYLEPLNSEILFTLSKPIAVQGGFQIVKKDSEGALTTERSSFERTSYTVHSDTFQPIVENLRNDNQLYTEKDIRYLQLPPKYDERILKLANEIIKKNNAVTRYDQAKTIEKYLQTQFGYTLELKAGGDEPLADFLFNVREGHCEYFATAMAIMLRTQGIATRVVNGFQQGEFNETAGVYVVKQKDAHSWVEVYFPKEKVWIPFDPTPFAGQFAANQPATSIFGKVNKYLEALETFWIQYFVAYDNQEQQSLFKSVKSGFNDYKNTASTWLASFQKELEYWWKDVRGDKGFAESIKATAIGAGYIIAFALGIFLLVWLFRKIYNLAIWNKFGNWVKQKNEATIIEFYERLQKVLASKGFQRKPHQTPLEFAFALNMPEAVKITEKYNRVRFGEKDLSKDESKEIENWLEKLETNDKLK